MNNTKKIFFFTIGIITLLGLLHIGINSLIESKLSKLINNENNSIYKIDYQDIDLSLWNFNITIHQLIIAPKINIEKFDKTVSLHGTVAKLEVNEFDLWSILFGKKIKASSLVLSKPTIILHKNKENTKNEYTNINSKVAESFEKTIVVSELIIKEGNLLILDIENEEIILNATNINFNVEGIVLNENTINKKLPVAYKKYTLVCDSIQYRANEFYTIKSNKIIATQISLQVKNLQLIPKFSRKEFIKKITKEKDLYTILAEDISLNKMIWGFEGETFFFKTNSIVVNKMAMNIYRSKIPADDLSKKELYTYLLRNLKADIKIDTLQIKNSFLTYEEEKTVGKEPGKLIFSNFNMLAQAIESGKNKTNLPDVKINVDCNFMKKSPLKVDWSFNVLDKTEGFKIRGSIFNFDAKELVVFTKAYINIKVNGKLEEVYFNFAGNDLVNKGQFSLKYKNLKVIVYRDDKQNKKNKFLSVVGNLVVSNDSNEELKTAEIKVERDQEKSFYNFLWISISDGLKQILI
jgi:hypothetical protein